MQVSKGFPESLEVSDVSWQRVTVADGPRIKENL